jgi:hypothetical protein
VPAPYHLRLTLAVALLGQLAVTFGLPVPVSGVPSCGCAPAERAAHTCCCSAGSAEDVAPCCKASSAPKPAVAWVGGVLRQKCHGPPAIDPSPSTYAAVPPGPPTTWTVLIPSSGLSAALPSLHPVPTRVPDAPPPRPVVV